MARFAERADPAALTAQEIVDQLGAYLSAKYQAAESYLVGEIARRVAGDMTTDSQEQRLRSIRALREAAEQALAEVNGPEEARRIVDVATREGTAAAVEQLGFTQAATGASTAMLNGEPLPFAVGLTPQAATAAAQIGLELANALDDVRQRILRSTADAYQETIARFAGERALGVTTGRQSRTRAVADFLGQGLTGFTDRAGRNWRIGSYVEMASRTATNRAWISAHVARWQAAGISLVSIVRGVDSCQECATWSGRILSTDGTPAGTVTLEHATTGEPVTLTIAGTLDDARAGGWNHPNCRCTLAPVFPGLSLPADDSTYDPQQEKDRDRLRALERRVRDLKRREQVAAGLGDDVAAAAYRRQIRAAQGDIRDHVAATGQLRKPYREALSFADGAPGTLPDPTPAPIIPDLDGPVPGAPAFVRPPVPPPLRPRPVRQGDGIAGMTRYRDELVEWERDKLAYEVQIIRAAAPNPRPTAQVIADINAAQKAPEVAEILAAQVASRGITVTGISSRASVDTAREFASEILTLLDEYPTARLHEIGYGSFGPRVYARAEFTPYSTRTALFMNTRFATTARRQELLDSLERDVANGFHPRGAGSVAGVTAHEFGHVLDYATEKSARTQVTRIVNEYTTDTLGLGRLSAEAAEWRRANLPGYSLRKSGGIEPAEALAEAFSDVAMNGAAALPLHTLIVDELRRRLPE